MDTLALSIRTRVTSELNTATRIANAETTNPPATSDRRYVVRSMALMLPSLTQQRGSPPALKRRGHSHTEVPAGTWHMDITSPTVDRSLSRRGTAAANVLLEGEELGDVFQHSRMSARDAVDGSSTGTRVPRMWALANAPTIQRSPTCKQSQQSVSISPSRSFKFTGLMPPAKWSSAAS